MSAPLSLFLPVYTPELPKKFHGFGVYGIRRAREEDVTCEPFESRGGEARAEKNKSKFISAGQRAAGLLDREEHMPA
jgi:hypothetical protein